MDPVRARLFEVGGLLVRYKDKAVPAEAECSTPEQYRRCQARWNALRQRLYRK